MQGPPPKASPPKTSPLFPEATPTANAAPTPTPTTGPSSGPCFDFTAIAGRHPNERCFILIEDAEPKPWQPSFSIAEAKRILTRGPLRFRLYRLVPAPPRIDEAGRARLRRLKTTTNTQEEQTK